MSEDKGFIGSLWDLSFREFITPKIIKFLFVLANIGAGIAALVALFGGFRMGFGRGLLMLILAPLLFLLYVIAARVWLEVLVVMFKIAENTGRMADRQG